MSTPTQARHPWRATLRTAIAVIVALAAMLPALADASGIDQTLPPVAGALALAAAITRIMALPHVDDFLTRFLPWLAAAGPEDDDTDPLTYAYTEPTIDDLNASQEPGAGEWPE